MTFATDAFAGTLGQELNAYSASWVKQSGYTENAIIGGDGQWATTGATVSYACYRNTAAPPSADYSVFADIVKRNVGSASPILGVTGRAAAAAQTFYWLIYTHSAGNVRLFKMVGGTQTQLGSSHSFTLTNNVAARLELRMSGSSISGWLNGTQVIGPITDTAITGAGHGGIIMLAARDVGVQDSGYIDNWEASAGGTNATASGVTLTATSSLIAGAASASSGATANGATLTATASLIVGGGTLVFQAAGMEFGRRTGLGINTFALDAAADYRYTVHADGLTLGAAIITSGVVATDAGGKLPNLVSTLIAPGTLYRVHAIRQADGEAATFRMRAQA
jgi:hypothetical protein